MYCAIFYASYRQEKKCNRTFARMLTNAFPIPPHLRTEESEEVEWQIPGHLGFVVARPPGNASWSLPLRGDQVRGAPLLIRNDGVFPILLSSADETIVGPTTIPAGALAVIFLGDQWYTSTAASDLAGTPRQYAFTTPFLATATAPTVVGRVPWLQAQMGAYTRGRLTYSSIVADRALLLEIRSSQGGLLATGSAPSSGTWAVELAALPNADGSLTLAIYRDPGGTAPELTSAVLEFS